MSGWIHIEAEARGSFDFDDVTAGWTEREKQLLRDGDDEARAIARTEAAKLLLQGDGEHEVVSFRVDA